ncbi:GNAT family N-acetyltransferase [Paenibacillus sp. HW567]|uniref:GNAT family N-acetyltransferase n=1 Tax=Paenibacillus sp. HW567 TaxID=1034769 RepID=UPI00036FC719|nr:GNAT family N-acetyltransferase [Paenibacillus sp. HW567]
MDNISIIHGKIDSAAGGRLNSMALDYMAYPLVGSKDSSLVESTLQKLWRLGFNRFSHRYAFEAQINQKTLGLVTCFPVSVMNKLAWPTTRELIKLRKWKLVKHSLLNWRELWFMLSLKEGRLDEYHIGSLATLPESRGTGIGSKLIHFAEEKARLSNYDKLSLTVRQENSGAVNLYEKLGFKITDAIDKQPYHLYRMVKPLPRLLT